MNFPKLRICFQHLAQVSHSARGQWLVLSCVLLSLTTILGWQNGLGRIDTMLYDNALHGYSQTADPRIVIIAIDDESIAQIGRWPWSRSIHAALLEKLEAAQPAAIGLDILFSESESSALSDGLGDTLLAQAIARQGKVVLPLIVEGNQSHNDGIGLQATLPIAQLAANAAAIGHTHLELDQDSIVRSLFLQIESAEQRWPHFSLAVLQAAGWWSMSKDTSAGAVLPGKRIPQFASTASPWLWQKDYWIHIPFAGPSGQYTTYSYAAVLRGEVSNDLLRDKIILVGPTAVGLWDAYPTPFSGYGRAMPGIEIIANTINALLHQRTITPADPWANALFCLVWMLAAMLVLAILKPRTALLTLVGLTCLTLLSSYLLLVYTQQWFAPAAALLPMLVAYPLWSWRRLDATLHFMVQQIKTLETGPDILLSKYLIENHQDQHEKHNDKKLLYLRDTVEEHIEKLQHAIRRIHNLSEFASHSLENLPDATLIATLDGHVLLANRQARNKFKALGLQDIDGALLPYLLNETTPQNSQPDFSWWHLFDIQQYYRYSDGVESQDKLGQDMMIRTAPVIAPDQQLLGWIATLIDVSTMRAAERQRDETLRFLSHDIRSPLTAIMTLVDMQRHHGLMLPINKVLDQIEHHVERSLRLADDFVQLAQAETREYTFTQCVIEELFEQAIDDNYTLANQQHCQIERDYSEQECILIGDRHLMLRVLQNLLNNALKYSPSHTTILCWTRIQPNLSSADLIVGVRDQGYGIAPADQAKLFRRFTRLRLPNQPRVEGIGLGLTFVKTVVEKHKGRIEFTSIPGIGTEFRLYFPVKLIEPYVAAYKPLLPPLGNTLTAQASTQDVNV